MRDPVQYTLDHVDDYLHDLLSEEDARFVEEQCEKSSICRAALDEARKRHEALHSLPPSEASEELIQNTLENIESKVKRRALTWKVYSYSVLGVVAAAAIVIGIFHVHFYRAAPTPYDIRVLGQSDLLAGTQAMLRVGVFDVRNRAPLAGVPIEVELIPDKSGPITLAKFETDKIGVRGQAIQVPDLPAGNCQLRISAFPPVPGSSQNDPENVQRVKETVTRRILLKRHWKLMLSHDKPLYQPGQTIHLRALALRKPDLKPVAGVEAEFSISDPKGNVVFRRHDVTSKFGITSADFQLATEIIEGSYQIKCRVGRTDSQRTVEVQKYVLPKFKVAVILDRPFYRPGDVMRGTLQADYFFGKPVAGGEVSVDVRSAGFDAIALDPIKLTTDEQGAASFDFVLPRKLFGREQDNGDARVHVVATVTDSAGQTYSAGASRRVTAEPIHLTVIPESDQLVKGIANTVYVYAAYADGRPAPVRLVVSGIERELWTNRLGVAAFELTPQQETVGLTFRATDDEGLVGRKHVRLRCGTVTGDFLLRPDKAVYDGGDTVTISAVGGGGEPVFIDLIKDRQTVLSHTIEMRKGSATAQVDLPLDLFGTLQLVAYRFGPGGLAVRKERLVFVRQANEIAIQADLDQQEYRPGQSAKLRLALTGSDGKPVVGAISLAAVDEAVFSVLNQSTGMEQVFFLLEEELLEPVYTIYNGWSPKPLRDVPLADREVFDRALFSRTAVSTTGVDAVPVDFSTPTTGTRDDPLQWNEADVSSARYNHLFSLATTSFSQKARQARKYRDAGLAGVFVAWISLAGVIVVASLATFAVARPKAFAISAAVCVPIGSCGFCLLLSIPLISARTPDMMLLEAGSTRNGALADGADWDAGGETPIAEMDQLIQSNSEPDAILDPNAGASTPPRIRRWFPETLLWRPELVTDEQGIATLDVDLADSITTWRLSASAVSSAGSMGATELPIRVFQPFFVDLDLPVSLTRGDEVSVPVVVYNYLDEPQTVELVLKDAEWFTRIDDEEVEGQDANLTLELAVGEIRSLNIPIKVEKVGQHKLQVTAQGGGIADALVRDIEVVPNGRRIEQVVSGSLAQPAVISLNVPEDAIEGSVRAIVKLHPSSFSQLVEGLDAIFQMPHGCFEQTSSTTYPNVLALDYLRRTEKSVPAVEAKARQYINIGYQRLISFEVAGGGFDWYGNPPADLRLTAYGLMEFEDMAEVYNVDPRLIKRTRAWLLSQRQSDGSWGAGDSDRRRDRAGGQFGDANLAASAYIAWAVFGGGKSKSEATSTLDYLLAHSPASIDDPYVLALVARTIAGIDPRHKQLDGYLERLDSLKQTSDDGKTIWWSLGGNRTAFYGNGRSGDIETTAMATLTLLKAKRYPASTRGALAWLVEQKDARGTWHSTQATVLALKALLEGTGASLGVNKTRKIDLAVGGQVVRALKIDADQSDVMQHINLSDKLQAGENELVLQETTASSTGYQVTFWYHVEADAGPSEPEPLSIEVAYDRARLKVDETVTAVTTVVNHQPREAPMVMVDLPIPGGFTIEPGELDELVGSKKIAKYQITARQAIVYLRGLAPDAKLELRYRLKATMPVKVAVPPAQVYEYYSPDNRGRGKEAQLEAVDE